MSKAVVVAIPSRYGELRAVFVTPTEVNVNASAGLLVDGFIYNLSVKFRHHEGSWYPVSGQTVTGSSGAKVRASVADPIISTVSGAVNNYLGQHPEFAAEAVEHERVETTRSLTRSLEYAVLERDRWQDVVDQRQRDLDKHFASTSGEDQ